MKTLKDIHLDEKCIKALAILKQQLQIRFAVNRLILFGSVARGTADEESDVDLLIALDNEPDVTISDEISNIIFEINLEYDTNICGLVVDCHSWEQGMLKRKNNNWPPTCAPCGNGTTWRPFSN